MDDAAGLKATVARNLAEVRRRIASTGRDPDELTVVAVTKGFGSDAVAAALAAGMVDVGENYAQELEAKAAADVLGLDSVHWHFLGRVQRNKVRRIAEHVSLWHTVDRLEVAEEIGRRAPGARLLVQVNISGEPQKGGCDPRMVDALVASLALVDVTVTGVMGIGPLGGAEAARSGFRTLRTIATDLGLPEVSMGMTEDLEVAVEEGATIVRVGRALFGPRPARQEA